MGDIRALIANTLPCDWSGHVAKLRVVSSTHAENTVSVSSTGLSDYESNVAKPLTVTVATARKLSGLGNTTIWALIKDRTLQTVHVGRRTLITYRSLEALLAPCLTLQSRPRRRRGRPCKVDSGVKS